jgi:spermidine/putrescine-binding protein
MKAFLKSLDTGQLSKMRIVAYRDTKFRNRIDSYDVLFNPENLKDKKIQEFSTGNSTNGSSAQTVTYKGAGPSNFDLKLFFDGTGIISTESVESQIEKLLQLVFKVNYIGKPSFVS